MRWGTCVKCGATTVRAAENGIAMGGTAVGLRPHLAPGFRGMVRPHQANLWTFACTTCGYVEFHPLDPPTLAWITQNWLEVPPTSP
jgi:predicted nucleic-acid-binding Zn-ribbon protein